MPHDLPKSYDPTAIEDRWAEYWVDEQLFDQPSPKSKPSRSVFTILLPPPNVTGRLHMGHMLNQTEMDILTRWHRMCGDLTLWLPGTDHAGIATQMMVERQLAEENTTREQLGREDFIERVWTWKRHFGNAIMGQMKRLGASVDWSREYFTMDDHLSVAVKEAFVRLYEQGLIYRGAYIVNWCPRCQTAISDLEVIHEEQHGKMWEIRYPVVDRGGEFLTIATTRPETMLGDVAVAVHPEDERYRHLHGMHLRLPLMGREIPVVTDVSVNRDFGTGAVKITPAHDANDFALGQRHGLPSVSIMDESGRINSEGGPYAGLDRFEARKRIVVALEEEGLLVEVKDHLNVIGKCDRCKTIVEPRLSTQWFVKIQPLADKAIAAVEQGYIRFTPDQYAKTYFEWMRNIHDWCISRQLWWGHRIPAWHCEGCKQITVARRTPYVCAHCGSSSILQETDVLDTWFSSGLLPCSVFGWPKRSADLDIFYPTQLLVTGSDILFFWVARMIMLGCHLMIEEPMPDGSKRPLKDAVPFREVYIHALVRDADRQKMSKTKGNVIDPIEIVERFGTDAVRFTLASMASPGTDIAFSEARTEGYRAFANKIWNAARFLFLQVDRAAEIGIVLDPLALPAEPIADEGAPLETRWIVSRLNKTSLAVNEALAAYRFDEAARLIYGFFWGDFCDWYLEIAKLRLDFTVYGESVEKRAALTTLVGVFESALRLLSPIMPFITEELWHAVYDEKPPTKSIAMSLYPQVMAEWLDDAAEGEMALVQELIMQTRALRKDAGVEEKALVPLRIRTNASNESIFRNNGGIVERLARVSTMDFTAETPQGAGVRATPEFEVAVVYEKQLEAAAERLRLSKDLERYTREMTNAERQLGNDGFLAKAPAPVVTGIQRRQGELLVLLHKTRVALESLGE